VSVLPYTVLLFCVQAENTTFSKLKDFLFQLYTVTVWVSAMYQSFKLLRK